MRKLLIPLIAFVAILVLPAVTSAGVDPYTEGPPSPGGPAFTGPSQLNPGISSSSGTSGSTSGAATSADAAAPRAAHGSGGGGARKLTTGFIDTQFWSTNPSLRRTWLDRASDSKAGIVRIQVRWRGVVGSAPPLTPTNPADPAYDFSIIDNAVKDARARGLDVLLTVFDAPDWAEGKNDPSSAPQGTWKPDAKALGEFAQALAKRYSGKFLTLPRVRYFEAWNEPNLSNFMTPQWEGKKSYAPDHYRDMLNQFYGGVHKGQPGANVIGGATAPFGDDRGHPLPGVLPRMRPLDFLRKLFCLKGDLKPTKCPAKPHLDVLSHHPVNIFNSPHYSAKDHDDVEVADFHNVRSVLHAAERARHVKPKGHHQLWATEIWWYSDPPNRIGVPLQKHARWLEEGLYLLWKQGASTVINYEIVDQSYPPGTDPRTETTSGVFFENGKKKPAYDAWRFPFVGDRKSKKKVGIWGKAPASGKLKIQKKHGKGWHTVDKLNAHTGKVFTEKIRLKGKADLRGKLGKNTSVVWPQK